MRLAIDRRRPLEWFVPFALVIVAMLAITLASAGATEWMLGPVLAGALVAVIGAIASIHRKRRAVRR